MRDSLEDLRRRIASGRDRVELEQIAAELQSRTTRAAKSLLHELQQTIDATAACNAEAGIEPPASLCFGDEQKKIVEAPLGNRVIVNAPPGTGKTAVACGRIAHLIDQDVPDSHIWLVSFTRTAVAELRARIGELAKEGASVSGVVAGTVDSRAWRVINGFTGDGRSSFLGGYDCTISRAIELLERPTHDLRERLDEVQELIVDEAQDLVGDRAKLIELLIDRLPAAAGVTVLCDEAQAIYGFAEDPDARANCDGGPTLIERIRQRPAADFHEATLTRVYRTMSEGLRRLYINARGELLSTISRRPKLAPRTVSASIQQCSDGTVDRDEAPGPNDLLLFRRRIEVLNASMFCASSGREIRIRTSGLPKCIHPWVALLLADMQQERLTREEFERRWPRVGQQLGRYAPDGDDAWKLLRDHARDRQGVSLTSLREQLGRPTPPDGFVLAEFGFAGPIFSTIHASKGREADHVRLHLPDVSGTLDAAAAAEEARVLFVGASRARRSLRTTEAGTFGATYLPSQRVVRRTGDRGSRKARFEIGRERDLDVFSPVHRSVVPTPAAAQAVFSRLVDRATQVTPCIAKRRGPESDWRYDLLLESVADAPELAIGALSPQVNTDLGVTIGALWKGQSLKRPARINHLRLLGARTIAAAPDDQRLDGCHAPFGVSGFWLAPMLIGLPTVYFSPRA